MDAEALKLLGGGSLAAALLALIYIVGMRLVTALGELTKVIIEHTKVDMEHHSEVKQAVTNLDGKLDGVMDAAARLTPSHGVRARRGNTEG